MLPPITAMGVALVSALANNLTIHTPSIIEFHWFLSSPVPRGKDVFYCIRDAPVGKKVAKCILVHSYIHRTCYWLQLFVCWGFFFISPVSFDQWTGVLLLISLYFRLTFTIQWLERQRETSLKLEVILPSNKITRLICLLICSSKCVYFVPIGSTLPLIAHNSFVVFTNGSFFLSVLQWRTVSTVTLQSFETCSSGK